MIIACPICEKQFERKLMKSDHCHNTGLSRNTICNSCNLMIGLAGDSPEILLNASKYLRYWHRRHGNKTPSDDIRETWQRIGAQWYTDYVPPKPVKYALDGYIKRKK